MLSLGMRVGQGSGFFLFQEFELLCEFGLFFRSSVKFVKSTFRSRSSGTGYTTDCQGVRKKIYCVVFILHIH